MPGGRFAIETTSSSLGNQHLAAQGLGGCLAQHLPCGGGVALTDGREGGPEVIAAGCSLHVRSGHLHLGALIGRCCRSEAALIGGHLCSQAILGQFGRIGTLRTKELVDVFSENVGVGQQRVIRSVVLSRSLDDGVGVPQLLLNPLQLAHGLSGLLGLGQEGILDDAGVAVQQCRGFSAEVLENLKTFAADALQILVARGCARRAAVALGLYRSRLGIGRRLWER